VGIKLSLLDGCEMLPRPRNHAICHVCHGECSVPLSYIVAPEVELPHLSSEDKPQSLLPDANELILRIN